MDERWLSAEEIAQHLGVTRRTIYAWRSLGMPAHRSGRLWKFRLEEVDAWVQARKRDKEVESLEALRVSDELLRTFVRRSRDGIVILDGEGTILEWNEGQEESTGISRDEALFRPVWEVRWRLLPEEQRTEESLRRLREQSLVWLRQGVALQGVVEDEIERADGGRRFTEGILFGLASDGQIRAGAIVRDVTGRRHLEEELRERQALLAAAERLAHLGHWDRDLRSGRSYWSDEVYRLLGHEPGAFAPSRAAFFERIVFEDRRRIAEATSATERDGITRCGEFRVEDRQGSVRYLYGMVELLRDASGAPTRLIGTVQDITERKLAEEALRRSQEDLNRAQAVAHVGSWRMDFVRNELEGSEESHRIFGVPVGTPLGWDKFVAMIHPEDREYVDRSWQAALRGEPYDVEYRIVVGGEIKWVRARAQLERDREERLRSEFGTVQDITDRKRLEQALADASRNKDEFLAVLSHELRNPLAPLRSGLYVLGRAEPGGEQARRMQAIIERQVAHLTRLVDDLLDVTRISRGKVQLQLERLELGELVRRALEDHRPGFVASGVELDARITNVPMLLRGDAVRVAQIVGNLLTNAAKFTPSGGRVEVVLEREGGLAILRVRDTGVGIAREMLARIFEPFAQADKTLDRARGGLGLGLALAKGLVDLHGGTISAASEGPGRGAEFTVRLPLEPAAEEAIAVNEGRPAQPRRVLVVEDNEDAANSLKEALELAGHDVEVAYNGFEGLAKARAFQPEVVLCDIGLPGMDGYAVARACRASRELKSVALVALTGYAQPEDVQRAAEAGFDWHLAKPTSLEQLARILAEMPARRANQPLPPSGPTR